MDRKVIWVGLGSLVVILVGILLAYLFAKPPSFLGTTYEPLPAPEIDIPLADGTQFRLSDHKGQVILLFFGYTSCPDVCPTTLSNLKLVMNELGADAERVQVLFVTMDPDRDTPARTQDYASRFYPTFLGLSGPIEQLGKVWGDYGAYRELGPKDENGNYAVTHSSRLTVIDTHGNLRLSFNFDSRWQDILHDVRLLLAEK
ncbi:MAG: SCO family protein [Chloroflexi bacterium]|nr:SCO family protein [Chloroflexota bacterium]